MTKIVFKCLRCGRCCKNLFREIEGDLKGLIISPDERKLFPKKLVLPRRGIGWGISGPRHIISYQLGANECPHLSKDNLCKVHDKRPLVCQAFPLTSMFPVGTTIANPEDCSFVEEVEKKIGSLDKMLPMTPKKFRGPKEWQAIAKMNEHTSKSFSNHFMDSRVMWRYNLKNKEWEIESAF